MQRSQNTSDYRVLLNQNTIHLDSKWVKQTIPVTGSVEATLILSDCIIYHRNKYRSFTVDDQQRYGLLTSLSEIQRNYNISYKRAKKIVSDLHDKNLVNIHQQNFVYNQKFYTPTDKALDIFDQLHFERHNHYNQDKIKVKVPLPIDQSTLPNRQNSYKDKYKDKKYNNHNSQKNDSLLANPKTQNVKTVIFDFTEFNFGKIKSEALVLDYFTAKQSKVISILTYCYHDLLDIMIFNQMLHRTDLRKEAKDFKQLVTWAYFEATKGKQTIFKDKNNIDISDHSVKNQCDSEITIEPGLSLLQPTLENNIVNVSVLDNQSATVLPELTAADIQAMISKKQKTPEQSIAREAKMQSNLHNQISSEIKIALHAQAQYLLNSSNKLHLLETLSKKDVNDAQLIIKTAEAIITEYPNVTFNDLLDGVMYRLHTLPAKKRQQETLKQSPSMAIEAEIMSVSDVNSVAVAEIKIQDCKNDTINLSKKTTLNFIENDTKNTDKIDSKFDENLENKEKITSEKRENNTEITNEKTLNYEDNIAILKRKKEEKIKVIQSEKSLDLRNENNQKLLIDGLSKAGVTDKSQIMDTATEIINEYPELDLQALLEAVIYRLVKMPLKQQMQSQANELPDFSLNSPHENQNLKIIHRNEVKTSSLKDNTISPQASDITMPNVDAYRLRQDWVSKADQGFYTGILPESQQFALVAMIDYVKRKCTTITIDQEVYEWLYHMASNKDYYYSRARNFKHWCNIVMRQLMQKRLSKPIGFETWKSMVKNNTLSKAA